MTGEKSTCRFFFFGLRRPTREVSASQIAGTVDCALQSGIPHISLPPCPRCRNCEQGFIWGEGGLMFDGLSASTSSGRYALSGEEEAPPAARRSKQKPVGKERGRVRRHAAWVRDENQRGEIIDISNISCPWDFCVSERRGALGNESTTRHLLQTVLPRSCQTDR